MLSQFTGKPLVAQTVSAEVYYKQARELAFSKKDYSGAIKLSNTALELSPDYHEIRVFLGRLYYWNNQPDSSLQVLQHVFSLNPEYEDAAQALADVYIYEKKYAQALAVSSQGLTFHPNSQGLAVRKAKSLAVLAKTKEAFAFADSVLQVHPEQNELRALANLLREFSFGNRIGVTYEYTYFDRQFSNPWHLATTEYSRQAAAGTFTGRVSYGNRYGRGGVQVEGEAYPRISKTFYAYTSLGYSANLPVFPKLRAGFSLYANLPKAWEAEGGFRYLNFYSSTWVYTFSAGKYYRNFWFNGRTFLSTANNGIGLSYALTSRYYLKGADDYLTFTLGKGVSPDDRMQVNRLNNVYQLETYRIGAGYRFSVAQRHLFSLSLAFERGEYQPEMKGNQYNISTGYQLRF